MMNIISFWQEPEISLNSSIIYPLAALARLPTPSFFIPLCPNKGEGEEPRRGEWPSRTLNRGATSLPRIDGSGSAMEWRGV